jgi:hypothetical protein
MPSEKYLLPTSYEKYQQGTADFCTALQSKVSAMRMLGSNKNASLSEFGCRLSIATLSAVTRTPEQELQSRSRSSAVIALARQTAMYLAHTKFGISYGEVGNFFHRDRSTVAHACRLVEDRRDNKEFDHSLCQMENLIDIALRGSSVVHQFTALNVSENHQ